MSKSTATAGLRAANGRFVKRTGNPYPDTRPGQALTLYRRHDTPTLPILMAVNSLWKEIQANHPGTPNANIVLQESTRAHGHFAPSSWGNGTQHEIMLSTVSLALSDTLGTIKTVSTLLHEAAHAFMHERGIKGTSRGNTYHNRKFAEVAEQFGCVTEKHSVIGHSTPGIHPWAAVRYAKEIQELQAAVKTYRNAPGFDMAGLISIIGGPGSGMTRKGTPRKVYGSQTVTVGCGCGTDTRYRIPRALFDSATITCDSCQDDYAELSR